VPRAKLACGRVGDDGDGMAVQPGRPALRLLSGASCLHGPPACVFAWCRETIPHASWWRCPRLEVAPCVVADALVGVEEARMGQRLVV
jgi:hypothetical protein